MAPRNYWAPRIPMVPSKGGAPDSSTQSHFLYLLVCYQPPPGKLSCPSRPTPKLSGSPCQLTVFQVEGGGRHPQETQRIGQLLSGFEEGACLFLGTGQGLGWTRRTLAPFWGNIRPEFRCTFRKIFRVLFCLLPRGGTHVHSPTCIQTCAPHKTATKALCSLACHHCDLSPAFVLE